METTQGFAEAVEGLLLDDPLKAVLDDADGQTRAIAILDQPDTKAEVVLSHDDFAARITASEDGWAFVLETELDTGNTEGDNFGRTVRPGTYDEGMGEESLADALAEIIYVLHELDWFDGRSDGYDVDENLDELFAELLFKSKLDAKLCYRSVVLPATSDMQSCAVDFTLQAVKRPDADFGLWLLSMTRPDDRNVFVALSRQLDVPLERMLGEMKWATLQRLPLKPKLEWKDV